MVQKYGGPIDPYSPYSLYDVVEGNVDSPMKGTHSSTEYMGFHIQHRGKGRFHVQLDGHAGSVMELNSDDYDDVLELVDDLNGAAIRREEYDYQDDKEALVKWAGKIVTRDKQKAEEHPALYMHIPDEF